MCLLQRFQCNMERSLANVLRFRVELPTPAGRITGAQLCFNCKLEFEARSDEDHERTYYKLRLEGGHHRTSENYAADLLCPHPEASFLHSVQSVRIF